MLPSEPSREPLILVVDDVRSARILAARVLVANGYEVIPAASAQAALHALAGTPDIVAIVADWKLGTGDGVTLLELVGRWYPRIGRLLWTVDGSGCQLAHELGIPCVEKGSHYRDLLETLRIVLGQPPAPGAV